MLPPENSKPRAILDRSFVLNLAESYFPGTLPDPDAGKMVGYKAASGIYEGAYRDKQPNISCNANAVDNRFNKSGQVSSALGVKLLCSGWE